MSQVNDSQGTPDEYDEERHCSQGTPDKYDEERHCSQSDNGYMLYINYKALLPCSVRVVLYFPRVCCIKKS